MSISPNTSSIRARPQFEIPWQPNRRRRADGIRGPSVTEALLPDTSTSSTQAHRAVNRSPPPKRERFKLPSLLYQMNQSIGPIKYLEKPHILVSRSCRTTMTMCDGQSELHSRIDLNGTPIKYSTDVSLDTATVYYILFESSRSGDDVAKDCFRRLEGQLLCGRPIEMRLCLRGDASPFDASTDYMSAIERLLHYLSKSQSRNLTLVLVMKIHRLSILAGYHMQRVWPSRSRHFRLDTPHLARCPGKFLKLLSSPTRTKNQARARSRTLP